MRPFEGIKILDCTHVLAGPFAAYQLAVLGADVIKVDDPNEPDQSRESGADHALNQAMMGTGFLTQGSNKRAIALDLKTEGGRDALKRLVADWADVLVENYRPGAFKALGLGYEDLARLNPTLVYASMTAFGQGQYIDLAMLDVAMILQGSHITDFLHSGHHPKRAGNTMRFASTSAFPAKEGLIQLAASNGRQHRRFYEAIGDPDEAKRASLEERYARHAEKLAAVAEKMKEKTADEWEAYFQSRHVPAARVRELREALADPHLKSRGVLHRHEKVPGVDKPVTVPLAAFKFAHDGPSIERPPARVGEHTDQVLASVGYTAEQIAALRR